MITEFVPVLHVKSPEDFLSQKSEFIWEHLEIKCGHCSNPFNDWVDIVYVTYDCGCSVRLCVSCKERQDEKRKAHREANERKTIHSHSE